MAVSTSPANGTAKPANTLGTVRAASRRCTSAELTRSIAGHGVVFPHWPFGDLGARRVTNGEAPRVVECRQIAFGDAGRLDGA